MTAPAIRIALCLVLVLLGVAVIIGWLARIPELTSVLPGLSTMKFNAAACFVLFGTGLLALGWPRTRWLSMACGFLAALVGAVTLFEYGSGRSLIDELVVRDLGTLSGSGFPGRMSPLTAIAWIALGTALIILARARTRLAVGVAHMIAVVAGLIGFLSAAGYAFGAEAFWGIGFYTFIAVHTAAGLLVAVAATFLTRAEDGWLGALADTPRAQRLLIQLLLVSLLLPLFLGALILLGSGLGAYNAAFAFALFVPLMAMALTVIAFRVSLSAGADERARLRGEAAVEESRRRLAGIVDSAMDAIITVDAARRIVLFNPAAEKMFGYPADAMLGEPLDRLLPDRFRELHGDHIGRFGAAGVTARRMGALGAISGVRADGEEFPIEASISQVEVGGETLSTVILRDITERLKSDEARSLLAREVDHRAKNAMAVAQSLVTLTRAPTVEEYSRAVTGRISALARAHSLLSRSAWQGASLEQLIRDGLAPYAGEDRVGTSGPALNLAASAVQPMTLVIHELATNAVKHGALADPEGRIDIAWESDAEGLRIEWSEKAARPVAEPEQLGFGSQLLRQVVSRQLGGTISKKWRPEGLLTSIALPAEIATPGGKAVAGGEGGGEGRGSSGRFGRLLVVEDEALVALSLAADLEAMGWEVVGPAATLDEAHALLEANHVDVALLDVNLDGTLVFPLAEALRARGKPFVFHTGYEIPDPSGGFADVPVVRKPSNPASLSATLEQLVEAQGQPEDLE